VRGPERDPCILVADDEGANLRAVGTILGRAGFANVVATSNALEVVALFELHAPDLVLLDLHMPGKDGYALLEALGTMIGPEDFLPRVVLTGDSSIAARQKALALGATDFLTKPFDVTEVVLRVRNLLQTRALHLALKAANRDLEARVEARTRELEEARLETLDRLATAAEQRDDETGRHTQRVGELSARLARRVGQTEAEAILLRRAAPLHDLGKIGVPDAVLRKPGRLTPEEFAAMQAHTVIGAKILAGGLAEVMQLAERIARSHHEKWDGSGYPDGLSGEAIPLAARIVSLCDFFDALSHDRPYRGAVPVPKVFAMIAEERGRHFDPHLADAFLALGEAGGLVTE